MLMLPNCPLSIRYDTPCWQFVSSSFHYRQCQRLGSALNVILTHKYRARAPYKLQTLNARGLDPLLQPLAHLAQNRKPDRLAHERVAMRNDVHQTGTIRHYNRQ